MGVRTTILNFFGGVPRSELKNVLDKRTNLAYAAGMRKQGMRMYAAAVQDRLTNDWNTYPTSPDQEIRFSIQALRARARQLCRDEPIAKRYMEMARMNIVGPDGFTLQMQTRKKDGTLDDETNDIIEEAWDEWTKKENCTVTGTYTFRDLCNVTLDHTLRDGEFLARKVIRKKSKFPFMIQLLQPDFLNFLINRTEENGNITRMGVEFDEWRRPVAYHLTKIDPALEVYATYQFSKDTERVSADEILHGFFREHAYQSRGVTRFAQVMKKMNHVDKWEEAAIWNARASAGKMGFIETHPDSPGENYEGNDEDAEGNQITDVDPGHIEQLPRGQTFVGYNPQYPEAMHDMFIKSARRTIGAGLNVSYNAIGNDLEGVNFSSIRAGLLDERDSWRSMQTWFIENFIQPVFAEWLEWSLASGAIKLKGSTEQYNKPLFIGRRWPWVDPFKDVASKIMEISAGLNDPITSSSEQGRDYETIIDNIAAAMKLAESKGLQFDLASLKLTPKGATDNVTVTDTDNPTPPGEEKNELDELKVMQGIMREARLLLARAPAKTNGHLKKETT